MTTAWVYREPVARFSEADCPMRGRLVAPWDWDNGGHNGRVRFCRLCRRILPDALYPEEMGGHPSD